MYLNNKHYGELRWGLTATPKYDITKDTDVTDWRTRWLSDTHDESRFPPDDRKGLIPRLAIIRRVPSVSIPEMAEYFPVL